MRLRNLALVVREPARAMRRAQAQRRLRARAEIHALPGAQPVRERRFAIGQEGAEILFRLLVVHHLHVEQLFEEAITGRTALFVARAQSPGAEHAPPCGHARTYGLALAVG